MEQPRLADKVALDAIRPNQAIAWIAIKFGFWATMGGFVATIVISIILFIIGLVLGVGLFGVLSGIGQNIQ